MNKIILTIGITSYNRTKELKRCLESITTSFPEKIEVLVSEDKSPKHVEIGKIVEEFATGREFIVSFNSNSINLGFDRNLKKIQKLAQGEFILYMSDDDCFLPNVIDNIIKVLENEEPALMYAPFLLCETGEYRRFYNNSYIIPKGLDYAAKHINDSILFSGLIFRKNLLDKIDSEKFLNKNYIQVYFFLYILTNYGGYYYNQPIVQCVNDGENAYGKSESSEKNPLLANRKSVYSNLEFNKGLIAVIKYFDQDFGYKALKVFEKEFNLRSYIGLANAASHGRKVLMKYWKKLNSLELSIGLLPLIYLILLFIFGVKITNTIMLIPKKTLLYLRNEKH